MNQSLSILFLVILLFISTLGFSQNTMPADSKQISADIEAVLNGLETRYSGSDFIARFFQTSTIKAMDIADHAAGTIQIKRPGMMRWEYETPEKQTIITDGNDLWIYRPDDKQVMIGKAPAYFGGGKGASFLSDIRMIRNDFAVSLEISDNPDSYKIKLIPNEKKYDIAMIYLLISKKTFDVMKLISINFHGDETEIELNNFIFNLNPPDHLFRFVIPEGTEALKLED